MNRNFFRLVVLIPMLFLLTACPNPPPAEDSCNFVQNSLNRRVSWARMPIKFYIDKSRTQADSVQEDERAKAIAAAMAFWNEQFESPVFKLIGITSDLEAPVVNAEGRVVSDTYNAIYMVDKSAFANNKEKDEQARTSISYRGDFIYEADIIIDNSEQFYFEQKTIQASEQKVQFQSLMIHELGHVLGLGHVETPGADSVMFPKLQFGQMRPAPLVSKSAAGQEITMLELPEIDQQSLACEYQ